MSTPADYRPAQGSVPTKPGVYRFRDLHGRVVYVGKAKNLRSRLANYFQNPRALHPRTRAMVTAASAVDWAVVSSEVEALVLEHTWIKQYDPRFNVMFRDDKSYPFLAITMSEEFPRIHVTRDARKKGVKYFGPYAKVWAINETVDTLLTALPMRSCSASTFKNAQRSDRPCLLGYIDKCAAPCVGKIDANAHRALAAEACSVLAGDAKRLVRSLTGEMERASAAEQFEAAGRSRDKLHALNTVLERNAVVLDPGVDADVLAIEDGEYESAAHAFYVRDGRILGQRGWIIDKPEPLEPADVVAQLVQEVYASAEAGDIPAEVLVSAAPTEATNLRAWLAGIRGSQVSLRVATRGKKAQLLETASENARDALARHRTKRAQDINARSAALREVQDALGMSEAPLRIECYDISHTGGQNQVASMVVFEDALPRKRDYRQFTIRDATDDTAAMSEVITRRFTRLIEESKLPVEERETARFAYPPQLVVVDGGEPQVNAAKAALDALGISGVVLCGLAKRLEEVWLPGQSFPVVLPRGSESLYLMQRVRDEAHRFAIRHHRGKRAKALTKSTLDQVPGIGATRAKALLQHFGSVERLKEASPEQIALVPTVGTAIARKIVAALHRDDGMLEP